MSYVERGKVWAALRTPPSGRLRDVPTPRETEFDCEGPAGWISRRANIYQPWEEMPTVSPVEPKVGGGCALPA